MHSFHKKNSRSRLALNYSFHVMESSEFTKQDRNQFEDTNIIMHLNKQNDHQVHEL